MATRIFDIGKITPEELKRTAADMRAGAVAVFPTDTVYGIGACIFCEEALSRIYAIKERPQKMPFQLLLSETEQAQQVAEFSASSQKLAQAFWPGGLTLIVPPKKGKESLARGFSGIGLRVPAYRFLTGFIKEVQAPLASTSANLHGQPVITEEKELVDTFFGKVDLIFTAGTLSPCASSVVDMMQTPRLLREGCISKKQLENVLSESINN